MSTVSDRGDPPVAADQPRRTRATVYDVAAAAGVSIKTVSRVVNGGHAVTPTTRQRVLDAVKAMSYVPNGAARSLRAGVGDTIGLIVDSIADPWFATVTAAVEERALAAGMSVVIGSTGRDAGRLQGLVTRLMQQRVRGLILAPLGSESSYLADALHDHPVVCIDRRSDVQGLDVVRVADRPAAKLGVAHLIDHGHRRIAFLGDGIDVSTIQLREQGYREALRHHGIAADEQIILRGSGEIGSADAAFTALVAARPDISAAFASNPRAGVGLVQALHRTGRTDIAVVSFGDFPLAAAVQPAISVIDQDPRPIGLRAAELLLARIDGGQQAARDIKLPTRLIMRGSGELAPLIVSSDR
ncbi:MAG: LacI family transcriptional regulator [Actinomycetota bacterium]|nr:LacI family transcriptional regulator [Actinomycetota bacterium]